MRHLFIIILSFSIISCKKTAQEEPSFTSLEYVSLLDGTLAADSKQGGSFELTILPSQLTGPMESNTKANMNSEIELIIDKKLKMRVSKSKVIRIQGLLPKTYSIVELVDGIQTSTFLVDGSKEPRLIADYHEIYGNWMIREPLD